MPFYAAEYTLAHLNVSPEVRAHNITVSHLEAGQNGLRRQQGAGQIAGRTGRIRQRSDRTGA